MREALWEAGGEAIYTHHFVAAHAHRQQDLPASVILLLFIFVTRFCLLSAEALCYRPGRSLRRNPAATVSSELLPRDNVDALRHRELMGLLRDRHASQAGHYGAQSVALDCLHGGYQLTDGIGWQQTARAIDELLFAILEAERVLWRADDSVRARTHHPAAL